MLISMGLDEGGGVGRGGVERGSGLPLTSRIESMPVPVAEAVAEAWL